MYLDRVFGVAIPSVVVGRGNRPRSHAEKSQEAVEVPIIPNQRRSKIHHQQNFQLQDTSQFTLEIDAQKFQNIIKNNDPSSYIIRRNNGM